MQDNDEGGLGGAEEFIERSRVAWAEVVVAELKKKGCKDPEGHSHRVVERVGAEVLSNWKKLWSPTWASKRLAKFRARDHARTCRREVAGEIGEGAKPLYGKPERTPEELAAEAEFVRFALSCLNPEERRVIELRLFEERPYEEVAALLKKQPSSVRSIYSRALKKIKAQIKGP